jgi:hypothetical protein
MTYKHVKCRGYIKRKDGKVHSIQCKMCGATIADTVERTIGFEVNRRGERIRVVNRQLTYLPNYREIKIEFDDGSSHVTNGCANCLSEKLHPSILDEMHHADRTLASDEGYRKSDKERLAVGVVAVQSDQSGLV